MTEMVIALLMIVNGEIKEHRIQESMSNCLKGKRIAMRESKKTHRVSMHKIYGRDRNIFRRKINR
jgi:hypothetical protein